MVRLGFQHMRELKFLYSAIFLIVFNTEISQGEDDKKSLKVVSLAPSITEIIYELGLGSQLIGVSDYCDYPKEALEITKVGGLSPNLEVIRKLSPDVVIGLPNHVGLGRQLKTLGMEFFFVKQELLVDVLDSIETIGNRLGVAPKGRQLRTSLERKIKSFHRANLEDSAKKKVLIVVGRDEEFSFVYVAGRKTFYGEIIELLGGRNAYKGGLSYAYISAEGILFLAPDVIIELFPFEKDKDIKKKLASRLNSWKQITGLKSVHAGKVFVLTKEFLVNPGPRIVKMLEIFAPLIG